MGYAKVCKEKRYGHMKVQEEKEKNICEHMKVQLYIWKKWWAKAHAKW